MLSKKEPKERQKERKKDRKKERKTERKKDSQSEKDDDPHLTIIFIIADIYRHADEDVFCAGQRCRARICAGR